MTHILVDARVFVCETKKVFEFLKLTVEPIVLENWKGSWKVMEFDELKKVWTLN